MSRPGHAQGVQFDLAGAFVYLIAEVHQLPDGPGVGDLLVVGQCDLLSVFGHVTYLLWSWLLLSGMSGGKAG